MKRFLRTAALAVALLAVSKTADAQFNIKYLDGQGGVGSFCSMKFDNLGGFGVSYFDSINLQLKYAHVNGVDITTEYVPSDGQGRYSSLAFDNLGQPRIAGSGSTAGVFYWQKIDGVWSTETVHSTVPAQYISLALDGSGVPHISFFDTSGGGLVYATRLGPGSWTFETINALPGATDAYSSLQITPEGRGRIAYYNSVTGEVSVAIQNGPGEWGATVIDHGGLYCSLTTDPAWTKTGLSYIARGVRDTLKFAAKDSSGVWTRTVVAVGAELSHTSIAWGPELGSATPRISFYDGGNLRQCCARRTTDGGWVVDTVLQGFVAIGGSQWSSVALTPLGIPLIAFYWIDSNSLMLATTLPVVNYLTAQTGRNIASLDNVIKGRNLFPGYPGGSATAVLTRGAEEIPGTTAVGGLPSTVAVNFDLTGHTPGAYDLMFHNSLDVDAVLGNAFVVYAETVDLYRTTFGAGERFPAFPRSTALSDTNSIAYVSELSGNLVLNVKAADEIWLPETRQLTSSVSHVRHPTWSPDASKIAIEAADHPGGLDHYIYVVDADSGETAELRKVTVGPLDNDPEWSPVGDVLAYVGTVGVDSMRAVFTINADGSGMNRITSPGAEVLSPTWSPDGARIAFVRDGQIFSISSTEGEPAGLEPLTTSGGEKSGPVWSPDGRWIAYASDVSGNWDIWVIDSRGDMFGRYQITTDPAPDAEPTWSPDGNSIGFTSARTLGYMTENVFIASGLPMLQDADADLVPDPRDGCPTRGINAGEIDANFDGCADRFAPGFRQVKFWSDDRLNVNVLFAPAMDPRIADDSELAALQAAAAAWTSTGIKLDLNVMTSVESPDVPVQGDGRNSGAFLGPDQFPFGFGIIAMTPTTYVTDDTMIDGRWYSRGEIVDADLLMNTTYSFSTPTFAGGAGAYSLQSVATHELGHVLGLSHSCIESSTMFYVVYRGPGAQLLKKDDTITAIRAYPVPASLPLALDIQGVVKTWNDIPVAGAAVLAISEATGDTLEMTLSGLDGVYHFYSEGEPFRVYVTPLDGGAGVNGMVAARINGELAQVCQSDFLPEYYNEIETDSDFNTPGTVVMPGSGIETGNIVLNRDTTGPMAMSFNPPTGATGVAVTTTITVMFNEPVDILSVSGSNFVLTNVALGTHVNGSASTLNDDSLLVFTATEPLAYDTHYTLVVGPGITDMNGNSMAAATSVFHTQLQPPVTILSISPPEAPIGANIVIYGAGFDPIAANNVITFPGDVSVGPTAATPDRLYITVPPGAGTGLVYVANGLSSDNENFTVLPTRPLPVGNPVGNAVLGGNPMKVALTPDGSYAYVATSAGVSAVDALPASLNVTNIPFTGGCSGVVVLPDGSRALAIGPNQPRLHAIDAQPGGTFNTELASSSLGATPLGIAVVPGGGQVLIAYSGRVVLHSTEAGAFFGTELREWSQAGLTFLGDLSVDPGADYAYVATANGSVAVLGLGQGQGIVNTVASGISPREAASSPAGAKFVGLDGNGVARLYGTTGPLLHTLNVGGGYTGLAFSPEGSYAFAANFIMNRIDILGFAGNNLVNPGSFATGVDPRDIAVGPGGRYVYVVTNGTDRLEVYDTSTGPRIESVHPAAGGAGTLVTIKGSGFDLGTGMNTVYFGNSPVVPLSVDPAGTVITVHQPAAVTSGPISVALTVEGLTSNAVPYKVINRPDPGNFRLAQPFPTTAVEIRRTIFTPDGRLLISLHADGAMSVIQADPSEPKFQRVIQKLAPAEAGLNQPAMMAVTPDGQKLYVPDRGDGTMAVFAIDELSPAPLSRTGAVRDASGGAVLFFQNAAMRPDGTRLYSVTDLGVVSEIATANDSVIVTTNAGIDVSEGLAVHPNGNVLYFSDTIQPAPATVRCFDIDPSSPTYRSVVGDIVISTGSAAPVQLLASSDGTRLFAAGDNGTGMYLAQIDVDPASPMYQSVLSGVVSVTGYDNGPGLVMNHSGTALFYQSLADQRLYTYNLAAGAPGLIGPTDPAFNGSREMVISPDDARLYYPGPSGDINVVDLTPVSFIKPISGTSQIGVVNQPLPAPFVLQVTAPNQLLAEGAPFRFDATAAGGSFGEGDAYLYAAADASGFLQATYTAGPGVGTQTTTVDNTTILLSITADVIADTSALPPAILSFSPTPVAPASVTTPIVVDFSKSLEVGTVDNGSFALRLAGGGATLPGIFTFTNSGRRVVFQPDVPLQYSTNYEVQITAAIHDQNGNTLSNPGTYGLSTGNPPPLVLSAMDPPAARVGDPVVLSGSGFSRNAVANRVFFGAVEAAIQQSDPAAITVLVPGGAATGPVTVQASGTPSNALQFTLIIPAAPVNNVVANIPVPTSGQQIAIVPDGSRAYMTAPGANAVVPINLTTRAAEPSIPVGVSPFGIVSSPSGDRIFVTNFFSNSLSIIDTNPADAAFKTVIHEVTLGLNPTGVVTHPDGRSVYAINYGDKTLMIIDTDSTSAAYNTLRATATVSSITQAIAITPDGTLLIVGTSDGILMMDAANPGDVNGQVKLTTGSASTSVGVTPDGGLVVFLTADGDIYLVEIISGTEFGGQVKLTTGSVGTSVGVSPDGGFVYVTLIDGTVLVFQIVQIGGGGASVSREGITSQFGLQLVDTIEVGENPVGQAFDPSGSGLLLVVNAGSNDVSFISTSATNPIDVVSQLDVNPNTLNFSSRGQYITAYIEFARFLDPLLMDFSSVRLNGTVSPSPETAPVVVDHDVDGLMERQVRFSRDAVAAVLPEGQKVLVTITGTIADRPFSGEDSLRVIRPVLHTPAGGQMIAAGQQFRIEWTPGQTGPADQVDIYWSRDLGAHWDSIGVGLPDDSSEDWLVPDLQGDRNLIMLVARDSYGEVIGVAGLDAPFTITSTSDAREMAPPKLFAFRPAFPNPSAGPTTLGFDLPEAKQVTIKLYGVDGRLIRVVTDNRSYPVGRHAITWDGLDGRGTPVGTGVYFVRIDAGGWTALQKLVRTR